MDKKTRDQIGGLGRALRPISNASSAFNVSPHKGRLLPAETSGWMEGYSLGDIILGEDIYAERKRPRRATTAQSTTLQAPLGPPWLIGCILYDGTCPEIEDLILNNEFPLDEAAGGDVLLTYVGNPYEVCPYYEQLRTKELQAKDEADARAYFAEQDRLGVDFILQRERHRLIKMLGIAADQLPCIAFHAFPPTLPPAIFHIRPEWTDTPGARREFTRALLEFFTNNPDVEQLAKRSASSSVLARDFGSLMNAHFDELAIGGDVLGVERGYSDRICIFQRDGATWRVVYKGISKSIGDGKGMAYIHQLLLHPGKELWAAELRSIVAGRTEVDVLGSAGKRLDPRACREYKAALNKLDRQIAEAKESSDDETASRLREKRRRINAELERAIGLGGRVRSAADDRNRAADSVSSAIHRALKAISREHEQLWRHFTNSLKIGQLLTYRPEDPTSWTL